MRRTERSNDKENIRESGRGRNRPRGRDAAQATASSSGESWSDAVLCGQGKHFQGAAFALRSEKGRRFAVSEGIRKGVLIRWY